MKKLLTIALTILITSCSHLPNNLAINQNADFKRDQGGNLILKTTKETNPYLGKSFTVGDSQIVFNPLQKLKQKPKIVYFTDHNSLIRVMTNAYNREKFIYIGNSLPTKMENLNKRNLEEAGILMGADLILVMEKTNRKTDQLTEFGAALLRTK